jgi:hypothetical protein
MGGNPTWGLSAYGISWGKKRFVSPGKDVFYSFLKTFAVKW